MKTVRCPILFLPFLILFLQTCLASDNRDFDVQRHQMVKTQIIARGVKDPRVIKAMEKVPRHDFVPVRYRAHSYQDSPLPIGLGQTISQPYIVAYMTEALELKGHETVLEIGTGSGYQTAILAELSEKVYSIERIPELAARARKILDQLNCYNVEIKVFDGTYGWKDKAPFDAIIVTAGAPDIPEPLMDQLAVKGRMVIPVGTRYMQELSKITRTRDRNMVQNLGGCRFVSLIGDGAWQDSA